MFLLFVLFLCYLGGQSTQDEMCVCTVYYYPSADFGFAGSLFLDDQYEDFFQTAIDNGWWNGTTSWSQNEQNKDQYYYNGKDEDALQHYIDFQATENRGVFCSGCPDGFCADYIIPEARDEFVALHPDDFGDCDAEEEEEDDKGLTDSEIIIVAIAAAVLVLIIIVIGYIYCKRRSKAEMMKSYENMDEADGEQTAYGATAQ